MNYWTLHFQIQLVWGGSWEFAFLTSFQVMLMLMFQGPTLRITIGKRERYNAENGGLTPDNPLNWSLFWGGLHAASGMHFKKGLLNSSQLRRSWTFGNLVPLNLSKCLSNMDLHGWRGRVLWRKVIGMWFGEKNPQNLPSDSYPFSCFRINVCTLPVLLP